MKREINLKIWVIFIDERHHAKKCLGFIGHIHVASVYRWFKKWFFTAKNIVPSIIDMIELSITVLIIKIYLEYVLNSV